MSSRFHFPSSAWAGGLMALSLFAVRAEPVPIECLLAHLEPSAGQAHPARAAGQEIPVQDEGPTPDQMRKKQRQDLVKASFEKMKRDTAELVGLAKALQEDLNKSNENVLSLKVVDRAEKIEKLAKRIKDAARGY